MKRVMRTRLAILGVSLALLFSSAANAGIWTWGCQGELGGHSIVFDRDALIILKAGASAKKPAAFNPDTFSDAMVAAKQNKDPIANYVPTSGDGLEKSITFAKAEDDKRKVVFTEKTSRRVSHKHKTICGRDEDTDIFAKTYSYQREDEPARDIKMQCVNYQLSTRGGRKGCD
jgi:hypothetical protein